MRGISRDIKIYLWQGVMDMRKSFDALALFVSEQMNQSAIGESVFVFFSRCRSKVKLLYWDQDGYAIWHKRLEAGRFKLERHESHEIISAIDLEELLAGIDFARIKVRKNARNGLYNSAQCDTKSV